MTTAILAVLGTLSFASLLVLGAHLAYSAGAGTKAASALAGLPAVALHTPSATFNSAADAAGNTIETVLKNTLTGPALQAFLAFLATGPTEAATLSYVETHFGSSVVAQCEAVLPALVKQELTILGGSVGGVLGALVAKAAPAVATAQAQQTLSSAQVLASLTALTNPKPSGQSGRANLVLTLVLAVIAFGAVLCRQAHADALDAGAVMVDAGAPDVPVQLAAGQPAPFDGYELSNARAQALAQEQLDGGPSTSSQTAAAAIVGAVVGALLGGFVVAEVKK